MMDKELLKFAAKAAGIKMDKSPRNGGGMHNTGFDILGNVVLDWHNSTTWNPLTDDGDALRLVVKLRMAVNHYGEGTVVELPLHSQEGLSTNPAIVEESGTDPYAATRRAIVRAASEIAKTAEHEAMRSKQANVEVSGRAAKE